MSTPIALNQVVSGTLNLDEMVEYSLPISAAAKYTVETNGPASILFGLWKTSAVPGNGLLRICGVGCRGTRILPVGTMIIQVTGRTAGGFSIQVRPWSFWDYFTINFYKSTC